jgi:hypothetical protein
MRAGAFSSNLNLIRLLTNSGGKLEFNEHVCSVRGEVHIILKIAKETRGGAAASPFCVRQEITVLGLVPPRA